MTPGDPAHPDDLDLPPALTDALRRVDLPRPDVPESIDRQILADAKRAYGRRMRFRVVARWTAAAASLAAAIAAVWIVRITLLHPKVTLVRRDVNPHGKVDMLDAYVLARRIAAGDKIEPKWDVNGDGVIDQRDVDALANRAVQIDAANNGAGNRQ